MTTTARANEIVNSDANAPVLTEFFIGIASCDYYDGTCYQLYLDTDDDSLSISRQASSNSWMQRDDGSLVIVCQISGYADTPESERYVDGCDINDYGYAEWLEQMEAKIVDALAEQEV
jgi:hypothetical protein